MELPFVEVCTSGDADYDIHDRSVMTPGPWLFNGGRGRKSSTRRAWDRNGSTGAQHFSKRPDSSNSTRSSSVSQWRSMRYVEGRLRLCATVKPRNPLLMK